MNTSNTLNNDVGHLTSKSSSAADASKVVIDVDDDISTTAPPIPKPTLNSGFIDRQAQSDPDVPREEGIAQFHVSTLSYGPSFILRLPQVPPSLASQYQTARTTVERLQTEKQRLKLQLRSLQHHLSLHKSHVKSASETQEDAQRRKNTYRENLCLLEERRRVLIDSRLTSIRGSHAGEYKKLFPEHIQLENRFRQLVASHTVTRYILQKLVIDAVHTRNEIASKMVAPTNESTSPTRIMRKHSNLPSSVSANPVQAHNITNRVFEVLPLGSVDSMERTPAGKSTVPRTIPVTSAVSRAPANPLATRVHCTVDSMFDRTRALVAEPTNHDTPSPVLGSSTIVTSTTPSRLADLMTHIIDALPPPDLRYPPIEIGLDRPILTWETSYERTKLPEGPPTESQDPKGELTPFLAIIDRFIPEKDGRRICAMCSMTVEVPNGVGLDSLQVLLDHLEQAHPRSWGKQAIKLP